MLVATCRRAGWTRPGCSAARDLSPWWPASIGAASIHKDVNPANSGGPVRGAGAATPSLIDFDLATTFAEERPGFTHHATMPARCPTWPRSRAAGPAPRRPPGRPLRLRRDPLRTADRDRRSARADPLG